MIDLRGYKVVYGEKVLNALCMTNYWFGSEDIEKDKNPMKPKSITVIALDTDGTIIQITDEGWMFQFIPNVSK